MQLVIFTDLDGTLLDYDAYSWKKASKAISLLKKKKIPLVFCTSKTRGEIEKIMKDIGVKGPFISENGGGIFIPKGYFESDYHFCKKDYCVLKFGTGYKDLRKALGEIKKKGFKITGFGDMSVKELSKDSGMELEECKLAKKRDFTEPFKLKGDLSKVKRLIRERGLSYTHGTRYHCIMGDNDKGKAVKILTDLFKKKGKVVTVGIGDGLNDLPMLKNVDKAYMVKRPDGYNKELLRHWVKKVDGIGPSGWNKIVLELIA